PAVVENEINLEKAMRIGAIADRLGVSRGELFAASWAALIWRLCGQEEIVIWEAMNARKYQELHEAVGLYARTVPVRARVERGERFSTFLSKVSEAARLCHEFQEYYNHDGSTVKRQTASEHPIFFEYFDAAWSHTEADTTYTLLRQYSCIDR